MTSCISKAVSVRIQLFALTFKIKTSTICSICVNSTYDLVCHKLDLSALLFFTVFCKVGANCCSRYCALQVSCPVRKVNRQWLSSVELSRIKASSLHSDISSCQLPISPGLLT